MDTETSQAPALRASPLRAAIQWQTAFVGTLLQAQQRQFQILANWQKSMAAVGQDQWDRWACRFGVPLDG